MDTSLSRSRDGCSQARTGQQWRERQRHGTIGIRSRSKSAPRTSITSHRRRRLLGNHRQRGETRQIVCHNTDKHMRFAAVGVAVVCLPTHRAHPHPPKPHFVILWTHLSPALRQPSSLFLSGFERVPNYSWEPVRATVTLLSPAMNSQSNLPTRELFFFEFWFTTCWF